MLKRTFLAALAVFGLMLGSTLLAQDAATLVLRSGERISGELIDLGGVGFTMRVNGQERQIPAGDVAVVEYAGGQLSPDATARVSGGQPLVVLRNGDVIQGRLVDIAGGGNTPKRLMIDTNSGQRDINASEVAQVYFALPPGTAVPVATSGAANTALAAGAISVPANQQWTPTGITVKRGDTLNFRTTGNIQYSPDANDRAGASGSLNQRTIPGAPIPTALAGALIGRVGTGQPFGIGDQASVPMPANGQLFLGVNDDVVSDNTGNFSVVITKR